MCTVSPSFGAATGLTAGPACPGRPLGVGARAAGGPSEGCTSSRDDKRKCMKGSCTHRCMKGPAVYHHRTRIELVLPVSHRPGFSSSCRWESK
eukprot:764289-Hanusia_phi.AAC.1